MDAGREVAIAVLPQWLRCDHRGTALDVDAGEVTLAWADPIVGTESGPIARPAGLAIGPDQRAYHAIPQDGRIIRVPWRPGTRRLAGAVAEDVLSPAEHPSAGAFTPSGTEPVAGVAAVALAVTEDGQLALVDATDGAVLVLDLVDRRLVRRVALAAVDLALTGDALVICVDDPAHPLWRMGLRRAPVDLGVVKPAAVPVGSRPMRVAAGPDGAAWLLWRAPDGAGFVVGPGNRVLGPIAGATDVEVDGAGRVVVAGPAGADLSRFVIDSDAAGTARPLRAPHYDGRGLARAPDGRIAFWSGSGLRTAYPARVRYVTDGTVVTFALDGGGYGQRWGRIFLDACLPTGTSLRVACLTADEPPDGQTPDPAAGHPMGVDLTDIDALPPGPPLPPDDPLARLQPGGPVYRRGPAELPWTRRDPGDELLTYEAPVDAPPGRYLWLVLSLHGTSAVTPRLRAIRVERPGAHLIDKLPAVFSAEPRSAAFLDRYLTLLAGPLLDADTAAAERSVLLDPCAVPPELLPWLASLVGLVLDDRWPEPARRTLIARAVPLFQAPVLVERFRFRGVADPTRVGATFTEYAHRFSVVLREKLTAAQDGALRHLLDEHRPAHTLVEVCTAGSARLGIGLHLELTSVIGAGGDFTQLAVGGVLGGGAVLGHPTGAVRIGSGRLGQDARVEP